jgi:hypothetical protein
MVARITLVHGDPIFAGSVANALRAKGHEVLTFSDPAFAVPPPRVTDGLEIVITQATGRYCGVRVRVTGLPKDKPYAGALSQFLSEPVEVRDVVRALALFVG